MGSADVVLRFDHKDRPQGPSLAIITPVGPGHGQIVERCKHSVYFALRQAWSRAVFGSVEHILVDDTDGKMGRCAARNAGMREAADARWYFFLDADDEMHPEAFRKFSCQADAVFGKVTLKDGPDSFKVPAADRPVTSWHQLFEGKPAGTLSMGAFFRGCWARRLGWNEDLDAGEDWEFYLNFIARHTFVKEPYSFVIIGSDVPSARGPRGYRSLQWLKCITPLFEYWKQRGRVPLPPGERARVAQLLKQPKRR